VGTKISPQAGDKIHEGARDLSQSAGQEARVQCERGDVDAEECGAADGYRLIILGALIRVTQALNFAPVGAISLFAGARLRGWQAYAVPLALMAITRRDIWRQLRVARGVPGISHHGLDRYARQNTENPLAIAPRLWPPASSFS